MSNRRFTSFDTPFSYSISALWMRDTPFGSSSRCCSDTCLQAMCICFREMAGLSEHLVPRRISGFVRLLSSTHKLALHARMPAVKRIELFEARQQDIAIGQIKCARVPVVRVTMCHGVDDTGCELELVHVAKGLFDEQNAFAIVRPIGTFAEPCKPSNVRWQVVSRVSCDRCCLAEAMRCAKNQQHT